jgi:hypothetical protein
VINTELPFEAIAWSLFAGKLEDQGVDVKVDLLDGLSFEPFAVELGAAVDGWMDDYAAGVGFEGILFGFPGTCFVIVLFGQ